MNEKIQTFHQHILKLRTGLIKPDVSIWCGAQLTEQSSTAFHMNEEGSKLSVMRFWESIKKRLNKSNQMKIMKRKATAGLELLAVGGLLTGGSVMVEKTDRDIISPNIGPRSHIQLRLRYSLDKVQIIAR